MSFFIRSKPSKKSKKDEKGKKPPSNVKKGKRKFEDTIDETESYDVDDNTGDDDIEANGNLDNLSGSDEDLAETTQEKKIRLAKKYLEEIERQEKERIQSDAVDQSVIEDRLKYDLQEQTGGLHKSVADKYTGFDENKISVLKFKHQKLPVTCAVVSADSRFIYSGSKDGVIVKWSFTERKVLKFVPNARKAPPEKTEKCHSRNILCLAVSSDGKFLASGDEGHLIYIWNAESLEHIHTFKGHKGHVTGLAFRKGTHQLFSCSADRSVKIWSVDEMVAIETLFGHQCPITSIDALSRERAVTSGGRDNTLRVWKVVEESQLVFNGHRGSIDCVRLLDEQHFISGGEDGAISLWSAMKKKPLCSIFDSHGKDENSKESNWVVSVACLLNTDLAASGSKNGQIMLWKIGPNFRSLVSLFQIPVKGFVNSLAFSPDGRNLIAAIGQEHRLGRWWRDSTASNRVVIIPLLLEGVK